MKKLASGFFTITMFFIMLTSTIYGEEPLSRTTSNYSVGIDAAAIFYNQYMEYLSRRLNDRASLDIAVAYSPAASWTEELSYWYLQSSLRTYLLNDQSEGLYSGFGTGLYFSDTLLDFSRWDIHIDFDSSVVVAVFGMVG